MQGWLEISHADAGPARSPASTFSAWELVCILGMPSFAVSVFQA